MATLRLPSGEMRLVRAECRATVGTIGNADHQNVKVGKAGRKRHMGVRPQTRGTAMNPVDHPHGGGEGSTTAGPPSGHALGRADPRLPHPQEAQAVRPLHRARPPPREEEVSDEPFEQEGPVGRGAPDGAHRGHERLRRQADGQDLVAHLDDLPRDGRATRSPSTTAASTCPCSSPSRWSATSSASSRPRACYRGHAASGKVAMSAEPKKPTSAPRRPKAVPKAGRARRPSRSRRRGRSPEAPRRAQGARRPRKPKAEAAGRGRSRAAETAAEVTPPRQEAAEPRPRARKPGQAGARAAKRDEAQEPARAAGRPRAGQVRALVGAQGPPRLRPHPRQVRRGGARYPRLHAARGRARLEQAARVGRRQRRAQPRARRRRPADRHDVYADEGPTLKRFRPRAMGRATRIRKRTTHLTITLTPKD